MSILEKAKQAVEAYLDTYIEKSNSTYNQAAETKRKALVELDFNVGQDSGFKERRGLIGPDIMKTMARKDSIVSCIIQTRKSQISAFAEPQKDKYSPGFKIFPKQKTDLTLEEKTELANPDLQDVDTDAYEQKKYEFEKKRVERQKQQEKDLKEIEEFILRCGAEVNEYNDEKRVDFDDFLKMAVEDRYTYNHVAIEKIPTKSGKVHKFLPVSAGTVRLVSRKSAAIYTKMLNETLNRNADPEIEGDYDKPQEIYRYVQRVRGKTTAAWTEDQMIFKSANPSVDPEDQGYGFGEMERLVQIITAHLYAEAHNRNFFTQGIASKGILHIKGDNISRSQLEGFKRAWLNQVVNTKNAYRPPIIGMADDVKWVPLTQSNREMEYENWMNYLIKVICGVFQIDPAEINFDISKTQSSTLQEANNEQKMQNSKDKGLKPLLKFIQSIINNNILPSWNKELADKYEFRFVGLDAESRKQEVERHEKEVMTWRTVNDIRKEQGEAPIEGGDIILNGAFTQYLQMQHQQNLEEQQMGGEAEISPEESAEESEDIFGELDEAGSLEALSAELEDQIDEATQEEEPKQEVAKKSIVEYYIDED